jgi:hypothetical protein
MKTKSDLAGYLDISVRELNRILYSKSRDSYYRTILFYKRAGGIREINAVEGDLKNIQEKLLSKLSEDYLASFYCHGFTKERSIFTNASYHVKKKFLIKFDIKNFFPSIGFPRVQGMFMQYPFSFSKEVSITLAHICSMGPGVGMLPQGGVTSPYVANMICRKLDSRLGGIAKENNCNFTRYADDITFSTDDVNKLKIRNFEDRVCSIISEEGFEVNESKTKKMWPYHRQVVTGIIVNKKINVNRSYIRNLRAILYNCEKKGVESQIVKNEFKQEKGYRNSRLDIKLDGEGYIFKGNIINKEEVTFKFLNHIRGRLFFVGQVIREERKRNSKSSSKVYEKLLLSFYNIIKSDKKLERKGKDYPRLKCLVECEMRKFPELSRHTDWESRKIAARQDIIKKMEADNKDFLQTLNRIKDDPIKLNKFKEDQAENDLRFFFLQDTKVEKMQDYFSFPKPDYDKNFQLLKSLKDSIEGIGKLVHTASEGITKVKMMELMKIHFFSNFYYFHKEVREPFDNYFKYLEDHMWESSDDKIKFENDSGELFNRMCELKKVTRFGTSSEDSTDLVKMIEDLKKEEGISKKIKNEIKESPTIYTVTNEVKQGLDQILRSMAGHSSEIIIKGFSHNVRVSKDSESNCYSIIIYSNDSSKPLEMKPSRSFVNGALKKATYHLNNSVCKEYSIIAPFKQPQLSSWQIKMFDGEPTPIRDSKDSEIDEDLYEQCDRKILDLVKKINTFMHILTFDQPT